MNTAIATASISSASSNLLPISTTALESKDIPANSIQIAARWKDSKEKTISPNNRVRSILLPADIWNSINCSINSDEEENQSSASTTNSQLRLLILDSIESIAKSYLSTISEESNWMRREVNLSAFFLPALLGWQSELAALSGRLNSDEIKSWIASSFTVQSIIQTHGAAIGTALSEQFIRLASPNHGLTPEKAAKILTNLWKIEDTDSTTGLRVQLRLTAISKKNESTASVLDSIL